MKPTGHWLGCLAMAGSCLIWAGCGGSDVPDPDSDSKAAVEPTSRPVNQGSVVAEAPPEAPAAAPAPAKEETAVAAAPGGAEPAPGLALARTNTPDPAPTTETAPPAESIPKADSSGTDEMLRIGAAPAPTPGGEPAPAAGAAVASAAPAATTPAAGAAAAGVMGRPGAGDGRNVDPMMAAGPNNARRGGEESARPTLRGGGPTGSFGAPSGAASNEPDGGPQAFLSPGTAVQAFLSALKAKNKDRLSQATARRAPTEAAEKHQKIFAAILEQSISDEELDDMAKSLEGFQVQSVLQARSSGSIGVLIGKQDDRDMLQRTVMVRKEKEGWKVLDFKGVVDFKPIGTYRNPYGRRR